MTQPSPRSPIRRFDVFAEYNRLKAIKQEHLTAAKAKGYGLWLAKVVAAQKFGRLPRPAAERKQAKTPEEKENERKDWHKLGRKPQTDKLFDKEIVGRMGKGFYTKVFSPAVRQAFEEGKEYKEIRDTIRSDWKRDKQ
jgi:hypothetical protein